MIKHVDTSVTKTIQACRSVALYKGLGGYTVNKLGLLENVDHCGSEPERAETGILCHWWVDEWCKIIWFLMFSARLHNGPSLTPRRWSTECDKLFIVYASSIKSSLPYPGPLWPPSFLFSLAPVLQSSSSLFLSLQWNLSLALSRFISVELHGEEAFVAQNIKKLKHVCKFEIRVYLRFHSFNLIFQYMATCMRTDRHTHLAMQSR